MSDIVVVGAGGHAAVLIEAIRRIPGNSIVGLLDHQPDLWGTSLLNVPIIGGDDLLPTMKSTHQCDSFVVAIGGIRQFAHRRELFRTAKQAGLQPFTVQHPSCARSPSADIADGCQLLTNSVVNACAQTGENVIINTSAIVEHDCTIGAHSHIAPQACLAGGVRIGTETHIGLGAVVRENLSIGDRVIVGAGAVVVADVPNDSVVTGVPARPTQGLKS